VVYSVIINANGRVDAGSITVLRSDHPEFESASRQMIEQAEFSPACLNGEAVRVRIAVPVDFRVKR